MWKIEYNEKVGFCHLEISIFRALKYDLRVEDAPGRGRPHPHNDTLLVVNDSIREEDQIDLWTPSV